jgi:hypothetical protein
VVPNNHVAASLRLQVHNLKHDSALKPLSATLKTVESFSRLNQHSNGSAMEHRIQLPLEILQGHPEEEIEKVIPELRNVAALLRHEFFRFLEITIHFDI